MCHESNRKKSRTGIIVTLIIVVIIVGGIVWFFNTASGERMIKNFQYNNLGDWKEQ
ncbi:hypothetical protein [Paenibacillus larvae]|uniref:hypothetical protein n=1 Tax=Paenibacillus larvae TaxID=1464 RepID=UPI00288FF785|nr:hypothetical protein [Paenibacillus larvae]MDT2193121.1 hypothetical protein [Paenibacillus larvae]MDT2236360.1 hypothetical protein [Paenibacillus larvae]MDT2240420.1 hypothetical protein [Paenibacillus larvae]